MTFRDEGLNSNRQFMDGLAMRVAEKARADFERLKELCEG
jgi:hypothetical protein